MCLIRSEKFPRHIRDLENKKLRLWRNRNSLGGLDKYRKCAAKCTRSKKNYVRNREVCILNSRDVGKFYTYANSKPVNRSGIALLRDLNDQLRVTNQDKANILNKYFCSVFTDDTIVLPTFDVDNLGSVFNLVAFTPELVRKFL